jgi:F-type H+-transporting ATPase subunit epsilon
MAPVALVPDEHEIPAGARPEDGAVRCVIVTPERAVLDAVCHFVSLPMFDGELGVLRGRAPLIGRLGAGELRVVRGEQTRRFFVDGGFAQVRANVVTVLTPRAVPAERLDPEAAAQELKAALTPGRTPEEQEAHLKAQQRARAQLRLAQRVRGQAAPAHR